MAGTVAQRPSGKQPAVCFAPSASRMSLCSPCSTSTGQVSEALAPFERGDKGENPYKVQSDLQETMQALVGIVRLEDEMQSAVQKVRGFKERAARAGVTGGREYHAGWHTALDLRNLLAVSEAVALSAIERKESRGGHFREDYPEKDPNYATFNISTKQGPGGSVQVSRIPLPPIPDHLKEVIEEQKS